MSEHSTIEWTEATWNPVRGCQKISPGCMHCYAKCSLSVSEECLGTRTNTDSIRGWFQRNSLSRFRGQATKKAEDDVATAPRTPPVAEIAPGLADITPATTLVQ
jgi:protein gp37